jgi:hypothetical protein
MPFFVIVYIKILRNEIKEYSDAEPVYHSMKYETDILIYESKNEHLHKPRVVIETKIYSITTHDAITYSQKASTHKSVHPYLRYGIFLGGREHYPLPGRLFRHGAHFDFMLSWGGYEPEQKEWKSFKEIIKSEVIASRVLEEMIFNSRSKERKQYTVLHKPLIVG